MYKLKPKLLLVWRLAQRNCFACERAGNPSIVPPYICHAVARRTEKASVMRRRGTHTTVQTKPMTAQTAQTTWCTLFFEMASQGLMHADIHFLMSISAAFPLLLTSALPATTVTMSARPVVFSMIKLSTVGPIEVGQRLTHVLFTKVPRSEYAYCAPVSALLPQCQVVSTFTDIAAHSVM